MSATLDEIKDLLTQLKDDIIKQLSSRQISPKQIRTNMLSDISETLGLVKAGEFRSGNGADPGKGFSGVRMGYPPFTYASALWNLVGIANDVLQFGLNADNGKAYFGGGTGIIDKFGVHVYDTNGKPSLVALSAAETVNGEALGAGDVLIGDNSSGRPNLFWDSSSGFLYFRAGVNVSSYISDAGFSQIGAKVSKTGTTAVNPAIYHDWSTVDYDDAGFVDLASDNTKITIPAGQDGRYLIGINVALTATASAWRADIYVNGNLLASGITSNMAGAGFMALNYTEDTNLVAGDYVRMRVSQTSGGSLNTLGENMYIRKIG